MFEMTHCQNPPFFIPFVPITFGFSREAGWRAPCPARGVTTEFVGWKRSLDVAHPLAQN
jgi:hypothetical protein